MNGSILEHRRLRPLIRILHNNIENRFKFEIIVGREDIQVDSDFKEFFEDSRQTYLRGWADAEEQFKKVACESCCGKLTDTDTKSKS